MIHRTRFGFAWMIAWVAVSSGGVSFAQNQIPRGGHPIDKELVLARERIEWLEKEVADYTCTFIKRERVKGELLEHEIMRMTLRHEPYSVKLDFLAPAKVKGQQVVYVAGKNDNKLIAQPVGAKALLGPYYLSPTGFLAMQGQRYPITECGMLVLLNRLAAEGMKERDFPDTTVKYYKDAKVGDRVCTVTEIGGPYRKNIKYALARIYVDDESNLPIRFESYAFPPKPGEKLLLLEEYTYTNIKLNPGLTDADFVIRK